MTRDVIAFFKASLNVKVALLVTAVLAVASMAFAFISAKLGVDLAAQLLLVGVIGGALICLLSIGVFWSAVLVCTAIDRIRGGRQ